MGHLVHCDVQQPCISKAAGRRVKWSEIWISGVKIQYIVLLTVKCLRSFLGHNQCIYDFQQACISKTAGRRAKWSEIWGSGMSIEYIQCTLGS